MKSNRQEKNLRVGLLGLTCALALGLSSTAQAQITGTNQIALTDWDNANPGWSYGYFYDWNDAGVQGTYVENRSFTDPILDPTNGPIVYQFTFDGTVYADPIATNGAGFGVGFGTAVVWGYDPAVFTSLNLEDYILSWDARVEGLKPEQTTASCEMGFRLNSSTTPTRCLQKNIQYQPGSNWTHFVFTLDQGGYGGNGANPEQPTSYTTFTNGIVAGITGLEFNQNQHMPDGQFGTDGDNVIYLDNIKLEVISYAGPPPPPPPTVARTILEWNFDDKPVGGGSGGWGWSETVTPTGTYSFGTNAAGDQGVSNTAGVGGSIGWYLAMDNTPLIPPPTATWSGIGMNVFGLVVAPQWNSPDLADYQISFDCRVEGLAPDVLTTTVNGKIFLDVPDDTLQPPDGDSDDDTLLGLQFTVPAETNWQTFKSTLKLGTASDGTSKANFPLHFGQISGATSQFQVENLHLGAMWEYDDNNLLVIDNFKLERLYVGCPPLNIAQNGSDIVLTWGTLNAVGYVQVQRAANVTGPYTDVPSATNSPVTLPAASAGGYFRTVWVSGQ